MGNRFLYGFAMIFALVGVLAVDHASGGSYGVFGLTVICMTGGIVEIGRMLKARGLPFDRNLLILLALTTLCYTQFVADPPDYGGFAHFSQMQVTNLIPAPHAHRQFLPLVPLPVLLICAFHAVRSRNVPDLSARMLINIGVFIYLVYSIALILWMRRVPFAGEWLIYLLLAASRMGDIGAYLFGKALGRHKLIPHLSPGKTVEGALMGLVFSAAGGALIVAWSQTAGRPLDRFFPEWWHGAILGVVIGFAAQCGDLIKSALKRAAGVKDSGAIVPAFGGVLDLIDNFMLTGPLLLILILLWP